MERQMIFDDFDKQEYLLQEYEAYIRKNRTTPKERRLLRKWVLKGNSVYESPGSSYLMDQYPPLDYLATYRQDQEIKRDLAGLTREEQRKYLLDCMGMDDPEEQKDPLEQDEPKEGKDDRIRKLERDLAILWMYLLQEGIWEDAEQFLNEHRDDELPFL